MLRLLLSLEPKKKQVKMNEVVEEAVNAKKCWTFPQSIVVNSNT